MANHGNLYGPNFTFLGIPACDLAQEKSYADADVIILGAPIDSGTSPISGEKIFHLDDDEVCFNEVLDRSGPSWSRSFLHIASSLLD